MAVIYLTSTSEIDLAGLDILVTGNQPGIRFQNALGPLPGVAAIPAGTDAQGNPTPEVPAKGVPGNWYMCISDASITLDANGATVFPGTLPASVTVVPTPTDGSLSAGQQVCGVWA